MTEISKYINRLKDSYEEIYLVGFSVGATIAWICSESGLVNGMVGYYGSRIRDHQEIHPKCTVLLLFPEKEELFDVGELLHSLNEKKIENLKIHTSPTVHGYANPFSPNFSKVHFEESMKLTRDLLKKNSEQKK
ncbi:MAG: dienelactone hydrolase family protein [Bacilli bacterium]